ncbi:protein kinase [Berryella wangjianweii]|uniref:non-specific serine/threonine protein kinase n=1 Tax=Berryella wangjianweii TaxID=2734634 RepID=A0A6M8J108_9ACTN|nr:protein kinase [Berryella wangjianweii]QKF07670.1 protein kinase [Berryella wangjianweii]
MSDRELRRYLAALDHEALYRVVTVLKASDAEDTQLVFLTQALSDDQPADLYVRKLIVRSSGLGASYERLFQAQQSGSALSFFPRIFECYRNDTHLVVVMEYVKGDTLERYVADGRAGEWLAAQLFPSICEGVRQLHEGFDPPLIHRDLKPSNVMVRDRAPVIIDLGIARSFDPDAQADTQCFGTRTFAPPEQFGYQQTTVRSDVYALGMLLAYCLTGAELVAPGRVDAPALCTVSLPLRRVIARATAFDPQGRYPSVRSLQQTFSLAARNVRVKGNRWEEDAAPSAGGVDAASGPLRAAPVLDSPSVEPALDPLCTVPSCESPVPALPDSPGPESGASLAPDLPSVKLAPDLVHAACEPFAPRPPAPKPTDLLRTFRDGRARLRVQRPRGLWRLYDLGGVLWNMTLLFVGLTFAYGAVLSAVRGPNDGSPHSVAMVLAAGVCLPLWAAAAVFSLHSPFRLMRLFPALRRFTPRRKALMCLAVTAAAMVTILILMMVHALIA